MKIAMVPGMTFQIKSNSQILVLNASYEPINITSWKRAIILLLKEKAQVISDRVIRLVEYIKLPFSKLKIIKPSRSMIYKRDNNKCQYCGATRRLTIDHVVPRSKGGEDTWENLVVACSTCNTKKGDKFLEHTGMKLVRKSMAPSSKVSFLIMESNVDEWKTYDFFN